MEATAEILKEPPLEINKHKLNKLEWIFKLGLVHKNRNIHKIVFLSAKEVIVLKSQSTAPKPNLSWRFREGPRWNRTLSQAAGQLPLLYKETGWLFLRLRGEKEWLKWGIRLRRMCILTPLAWCNTQNHGLKNTVHAWCSPLVACQVCL